MDPTLMYVVYAVIILVVLILLYYFVFPTTYTLCLNPMTSTGTVYVTNDNGAARTFKSSGKKDGVFYETSPPVGKCQYALLVMTTTATDYFTTLGTLQTAAGATASTATPNVTASSPAYVGIFVSATSGVIDTDITDTNGSATTWLGICDLTVLIANLVAAGTPITAIGNYTGALPTVNKVAVLSTFLTATTCASWPVMPLTSTTTIGIYTYSGVSGNGWSIGSNKSFSTVYDSIYYHKAVATSTAVPKPST